MATEAEKRDFELFLELCDELNGLPYDFGDKPDIVLTTNHDRLGIEHTRLYVEDPELSSGQQLKPQEKFHFQITQRAFELFREKCSIPLYLTVDFAEPFNYQTRDIEEVAAALSLAVQTSFAMNQPTLLRGQDVWVYAWEFERFRLPFPPGVSSFHYQMVAPDQGFELWGPISGYCVPHLSVGIIESKIQNKAAKLETYKKRCDRCWLLIATDAGWRSSHFDVPPEVSEHVFSTRFERVFLMTITHRTLIKLKTSLT